MKSSLQAYFLRIFKYYLFIFIFFSLERLTFLLLHWDIATQSPLLEVFNTFYQAAHLDLSTASYIFAIPFILLTLQLPFNGKWTNYLLNSYTFIVLFFLIFSAIGNIFLYDEWGIKINYKIWYYLQKPMEVLRTATTFQLIVGLIGGGALIICFFWSYLKWFSKPTILKIKKFYWQSLILLIIGCGLIFIGIRGKITGIPISQSNAYFSNNPILNDAAVNTQWNLIKSTIRFGKSNSYNMFASMPQEEAQHIVNELLRIDIDTSVHVLNQQMPNIVIILLESWSADLIESLGGKPGITPCFHELEKEGLLFTELYASGRRSQEGISSIVSGFPPIPIVTITDNFDKYKKLGSIAEAVKQKGYHTSFYFGGDLTYGNLKAYLMAMDFQRLFDENCYPKNSPHGSLSIYDEVTLQHHISEMRKEKTPFFSILFTASTHSPYDVPHRTEFLNWDVLELPYLNSAKYTDYCLGEYFDKIKKEDWYKNTLFILVADHSHRTYRDWNYNESGYQHIPMLWIGGALKEEYKGATWDKMCSYIDLPLTIVKQLDIDYQRFPWSRDIFNTTIKQFVPIQYNDGITWVVPEGAFGYYREQDYLRHNTIPNDSITTIEMRNAKAFLQMLYQTYLDY